MLYFGFQIILLLLFFIALGTLSKHKTVRFPLIFVGGLFIILQLVSITFNGDLINYRFYAQLNFWDIWSLAGMFGWYVVGFIVLFISFLFLLHYSISAVQKRRIKPVFLIGLLFLAGVLLFLPKGAGANIYNIVNIKTAKARSFQSALQDLGIDPKNYTSREEIKAQPGKNIIVLSLESLERGYLEPPLKELTPNLRSIAKEYSYLKMEQQNGSSWTSASMYTAITGVPAYFRTPGNHTFQSLTSTNIGHLGSVLQDAGYQMSYLLTHADFSGMDNMLNMFGFEVKSDGDFHQHYKQTRLGIQDKDMFEELKKEILEKQDQEGPFAIFLSTISGHFVHGVYDERMETVLPPRDNHLEFMASAVDYYIGDLFAFLEKNDLLKNTEVFIYPDHKLMGKASEVLKKFAENRGLYVITTAEKQNVLKGIQQPVMQIDIPRMIVNGAGIQTNATFLSSFIEKDKFAYLYKNRKNLLALNEGALNKNTYKDGFRLKIKGLSQMELSPLEGSFKKTFPKPSNSALNIIHFSKNLRFLSQKKIQHKDSKSHSLKAGYRASEIARVFNKIPKKGYYLIYSVVNDSVYAYLKKGKYLGIARKGEQEVSYTKSDFSALTGWSTLQEGSEIKADEIFLKSTGWKSIPAYGKSRIYIGLTPLEVKRGVNLLYVDDKTYKIYNTDYDADKTAIERLLNKIEKLTKSQKLVAILVHDASVKKLSDYSYELKKLGLSKLAELGHRKPYIALFQNGNFIEKTGTTFIVESIPLKMLSKPNIEEIKRDTMRFIAHAGGAINGDTYTNSLEALNLNYKKGFRLFELDIIKTSDNIFVAAHDWKQWSRKTGFDGETPVSLKTFKANPIKNYTPMDITDINRWFKNHSDAILVTDKVNDPKGFSEKFVHKDRLMMELFSLEAAKEAQKLDIKVLLTNKVLLKLEDGKELKILRSLDIRYVAFSQFSFDENLDLLKRLKNAGIKTYLFNFARNYDENYVIQHEMDYVYGIYADNWDFTLPEKE